MSFVLFIENDMNLYLNDLALEEDRSAITDAVLVAHIGLRPTVIPPITAATNAGPIVITSNAHGLTTGDQVIVSQVRGNPAANGLWTITVVDANRFSLNSSSGDGTYGGGGVWYRAITGATGIDLDFVGGSRNTYLGRLARGNGVRANDQLVMVVECANYGVKFETIGVARVRT